MQYFLEELSQTILKKYSNITGELCIVTPNRRAAIFMRKHISAAVTKPIWAPDILSIEDFINRISGFTIVDNMDLMFEFYRVYKRIEQENADDIENFLSWAPALLRDFEDVDASMADRTKIYEYLTDIRYIDTWNPDGSPLTAFQQQYIAFVKKLKLYHETLADHLINRNLAWQTLSLRTVAERFQKEEIISLSWKKVIFAGFNALTKAEETIISTLLKNDIADYITDTDAYYANDQGHEAGRFMRKYSQMLSLDSSPGEKSFFKTIPKNIRIYGVARNVNQARLAGNLLNDIPELASDEQTAVVLANEALLTPLLNALPGRIKDINVTMGYPIKKTNMYGFFDSLLQLLLQASKHEDKPDLLFYHKDIKRFFSNSLCKILWDVQDGDNNTAALIKKLNTSNVSFFSLSDLAELSIHADGFYEAFGFLKGIDTANTDAVLNIFVDISLSLDQVLRKKAQLQGADIVQTAFFVDFESLYHFLRIFRKIKTLLAEFSNLESLHIIYRLFKQSCSETSLSFTGEPLQGLQVMGMLETRCLDFKNVVLLSVNENILPKAKSNQSFIPFEVKKSFGMRVYNEQDAIYAYHFYRLLQRAENIFLIYNTQNDDVGSSEKSRFITQLQYELPRYNPETIIEEQIISIPAKTGHAANVISITKSDDILHQLLEIAEKGFSPSALSTYINCPLQFYFAKVAAIEETKSVEETMEASTIGSIVHLVLEKLYRPFEREILNPGCVDAMQLKLNHALQQAFSEEYTGGNVMTGKNLLLFHLVKRYLENYLKTEKAFLHKIAAIKDEVVLLNIEKTLHGNIIIDNQDAGTVVAVIKGKADRIDKAGGVVRVVDYKTGKITGKDLTIRDFSEAFAISEKSKVFQLLCYAWMYHKQFPTEQSITAGIIATRSPGAGLQTIQCPGVASTLTTTQLKQVEEHLQSLITEILNKNKKFEQTHDLNNCIYCNYKVICNRF